MSSDGKMPPGKVLAYHRSNYVGSRMVVAGFGVDHDTLCRQVDYHFAAVPKGVCISLCGAVSLIDTGAARARRCGAGSPIARVC